MLDKFDAFIQETDRQLDVDTSTRSPSLMGRRATSAELKGGMANGTGLAIFGPGDGDVQTNSKSSTHGNPKSQTRYIRNLNNTGSHPIAQQQQQQQRQLVHTRVENIQDQPLVVEPQEKGGAELAEAHIPTSPSAHRTYLRLRGKSQLKSAVVNKRRSLIQPIIPHIEPVPQEAITHQGTNVHGVQDPSLTTNAHSTSMAGSENAFHSRTSSSSSLMLNTTDQTNNLLKTLANKELELFDSKRKIEDLKRQLANCEKTYQQQSKDLQLLKEKVSKRINTTNEQLEKLSSQSAITPERNLSPQPQKQKPMANSASPIARRVHKMEDSPKLGEANSAADDFQDIAKVGSFSPRIKPEEVSKLTSSDRNSVERDSTLWTKPLAILNQFDQILQNELEKSLNWDHDPESSETRFIGGMKASREGNFDDSPVSDNASSNSSSDKEGRNRQSVTSSIWNFVSDMKTGLLGIVEEPSKPGESGANSPSSPGIKAFKTTKKHSDQDVAHSTAVETNGSKSQNKAKFDSSAVEMSSYI
ncbi:Tda11p KNAG_0E00590 [Huiozyma naganishii CBS 8797]|uniref:Topoisomerase I damage affected protein 11 n=1 Tax=Huiozyma naganishii (strain ATCC MYA-139 / BCRC 22969 / CBS 8797 / KCTC 17520 / NBRC 10181 / NCYC 3082 / Yp74L-3) TaxID=1071383 RepID=J7RYS3_HUIN7|nr:hypothetical protein KNAG_0E00590 [Kazachstania naganishii CBS 8797]CCK70327.1 hypothetical protein KNAG_0E00590 [Kazachstania naganishii CBS 8797]